jgi:hypothetical protein
MNSTGCAPPHSCKHCQELFLNFSSREPWDALQPLHKHLEKWPNEWYQEVPHWILPRQVLKPIKSTPARRLKGVFESFTRRPKHFNQRYQQVLMTDDNLKRRAQSALRLVILFDLDRKECVQRAEKGCLFFSKLLRESLRVMAPRQRDFSSLDFILAASNRWDGLVFGIPNFNSRSFAYGMDIDPLMTFTMLAPHGWYFLSSVFL